MSEKDDENGLLAKAKRYIEKNSKKAAKKSQKKEDKKHDKKDKKHDKKHDKKDKKDKKKEHKSKKRKRGDSSSSNSDSYSSDKKRKKHKKGSQRKNSKKESKLPKSSFTSMPPPINSAPGTLLSVDDYFTRNKHLQVYVFRSSDGKKSLSDLSTDDSHQVFEKFIALYNKGKLPQPYYNEKMDEMYVNECKRTTHSWGLKVGCVEKESLDLLKANIKQQTEDVVKLTGEKKSFSSSARATVRARDDSNNGPSLCQPVPGSGDGQGLNGINRRLANKNLKDRIETGNAEIYGIEKREGHERLLEKRRETSAKLHGSARDREEVKSGIELSDADIYGNGGRDDLLSRDKARRENKHSKQQDRVKELQAKEDKRKADMLASLGLSNLQGKGKITIAPR